MSYTSVIADQADRALWEVCNVIHCVPDSLWEKNYCAMPLWKHIYHMLHSLDQWYINPRAYTHPPFHVENLNNLDAPCEKTLTRAGLMGYFELVRAKITVYNHGLTDAFLLEKPGHCEWDRFTLILAQHRHLHSHMGMIMGFIIAETGRWPETLGLERPIPNGCCGSYM